jgi:predicted metal-dependent hydrolase
MPVRLQIGDIAVAVSRKDIRNIHLSVYPPDGAVRVTAPRAMSMDAIRAMVITRLPWIRAQQRRFRSQEREAPREFLNRESHFVWGRRYLLRVVEQDTPPSIELRPRQLLMRIRPGTPTEKREALLDAWYRGEIRAAAASCVGEWEPRLGVRVRKLFVQRMKTKWGACNHRARTIRLNTELARKPLECLEYIVVHEMVHILEPNHGPAFVAWMDRLLPHWRERRNLLNRLPVRHEQWRY